MSKNTLVKSNVTENGCKQFTIPNKLEAPSLARYLNSELTDHIQHLPRHTLLDVIYYNASARNTTARYFPRNG